MSTPARHLDSSRMADPLEVLVARAKARAHLWASCDILDLIEAVDPLQEYAVSSGLVDLIGQDAVQKIIADAFRPHRVHDYWVTTEERPTTEEESTVEEGLTPEQWPTLGERPTTDQWLGWSKNAAARIEAAINGRPIPDRPTPQATIEAIMYSVRDRGIDALYEPETAARLESCDERAGDEIIQRIKNLDKAGRLQTPHRLP